MLQNNSMTIRAALLLALAACGGCQPTVAVSRPTLAVSKPAVPFRPSSSIQDIMVSIVDPAADALWEAVSTESTLAGTVEHQPRSEQEWAAVRQHAVTLVEASNLLLIEDRAVTHGEKKVEDAHVPGILLGPEIQRVIDASRPRFAERAHQLHDAASQALAAIDARDPVRLLAAGASIDQACERCHMTYWYPNAEQPVWPAPLVAAPNAK